MLPEAKTGVYLIAYLRSRSNSTTKQNGERKFYSVTLDKNRKFVGVTVAQIQKEEVAGKCVLRNTKGIE